jgi:hypothetical protein
MSVESILLSDLLADAGLSALIGNRLYQVQLPQNPTYPCGIFQRVSTQPLYVNSVRGRNPLTGGQATAGWARFSFAFWSNDGKNGAAIVDSIALALMAAMENVNLIALPTSPATINNAPNFLLTRRMSIEPQTQPPLFKALLDFKCWYSDQ